MSTSPQATERPQNHKVVTPKAKQPTPPKLPYELACKEQAIARALGPIDVGSELDKVNALLQAANDARNAFLDRHNYVTRQTGS